VGVTGKTWLAFLVMEPAAPPASRPGRASRRSRTASPGRCWSRPASARRGSGAP